MKLNTSKLPAVSLLAALLMAVGLSAQPKPIYTFEKVTAADFSPRSPLVNENADAVILADVGSVEFEGNSKGWFTYVFRRQKRILIRKLAAMDLASVRIGLYQDEDGKEKLDKLNAVSYTLEGDKVQEVKLQGRDVYEEKQDPNHLVKKFSLPGVKEGSIIEYSYIIRSEFLFNLPSWDFQSEHGPTLWSEYYVELPGLLGYMSVRQGYHSLVVDRATEGHKIYNIRRRVESAYAGTYENVNVSVVTAQHRWAMKEVPGLKGEKYMYSASNFVDRISLQLSQTFDGESYHDVSPNWTHMAGRLLKHPDLGGQLGTAEDWMNEIPRELAVSNEGDLASARSIYRWLQSAFTNTGRSGIFVKKSLRDVVKKKSGTAAELNLLLIALLRQRLIEADPVLLSTRSYGRNNPNYPLMEKLDHLVCRAVLGKETVFLDVSDKRMPFGKLPLECYNGHARIIRPDTAIAVVFSPDAVTETSVTDIWLSPAAAAITGRYTRTKGFYEPKAGHDFSISDTRAILQAALQVVLPDEFEADSIMANTDSILQFDFKLPAFRGSEVVYFSTMLLEPSSSNPFTAVEREYPVELPCRENKTYVLNMEIPEGYKVEELPASVKYSLSGGAGYFEFRASESGGILSLRRMLVLNKVIFDAGEYPMLREFYAQILKKETEQIVFRKKK